MSRQRLGRADWQRGRLSRAAPAFAARRPARQRSAGLARPGAGGRPWLWLVGARPTLLDWLTVAAPVRQAVAAFEALLGVVQNLPFLGHTGARTTPAGEGRIATG